MTREALVDELSRFVCDPRAGATVTLTLDRDDAWTALGSIAYETPGVMLHARSLDLITGALETHAQALLAPRPQPVCEAQACVARSRAISQLAARIGRLESADLFRLAPVGP